MTEHDLITLGAMGAITGVTIIALVLGVADGLVAAAITALATLGGVKVALRQGQRG